VEADGAASSRDNIEEIPYSGKRGVRGDGGAAPLSHTLALSAVTVLDNQATHQSALLIKALNELRKIDQILSRCAGFWASMDSTIERLSQMKDRTERLISYGATHPRFRQRFEQRLEEYRHFWEQLRALCQEYLKDAAKRTEKIYEFLITVGETADCVDSMMAMLPSAAVPP